MSNQPSKRTTGNSAEVVLTRELSTVVGQYVQRYRADRPRYQSKGKPGHHDRKNEEFMGVIEGLAWESGVPARRINAIIDCETRTTSVDVADALLTAIGRSYMLAGGNGGVRVIPNPTWSTERWAAYMTERGVCGYE